MARKYGELNDPTDVTQINNEIRAKVRKAKTKKSLRKLARESMYLYTLTFSPNVKKNIVRGKILATRNRAKRQGEAMKIYVDNKLKRLKLT